MISRKVILPFVLCFHLFASTEYLVHVENMGHAAARHYPVVEQLDQHYFIRAGESSLTSLAAFEQFSVLDSNPGGKLYILVDGAEGNSAFLAEHGAVLGNYNGYILVGTTEENCIAIVNRGFDITRISSEPIQYATDIQVFGTGYIKRVEPLIEEMVASISEDSIRYFIRSLQNIKTRYCTSTENKTIACPMIFNWLKAYGCDSVYNNTFNTAYGPNVIGIKKGKIDSSYTKYCVIGGHIDGKPVAGRAPAADDNGTGVALFLEVARVLKKYTFENTIQFQGWNAEEMGDVGSSAYAKYAKTSDHTIIGGTLVFDMIGCTLHGKNVEVFYNTASTDFALNVFKKAADTYTSLNYTMKNGTVSTDQSSFWKQGYNAVGCVENNYSQNVTYHRADDTLDHPEGLNDTRHVTEVAKAACAIVATLAKPMNISPVVLGVSTRDSRVQFRCIPVSKSTLQIGFLTPIIRTGVDFNLYTLQGRLLYSTYKPVRTADYFDFLWEIAGSPLKSGFYFVQMRAGENICTQKIVVP